MGFGSYDESEQEQPSEQEEEDNGESVTKKGVGVDGDDSIEDESMEDMMKHL
jgi:hypothetical protein